MNMLTRLLPFLTLLHCAMYAPFESENDALSALSSLDEHSEATTQKAENISPEEPCIPFNFTNENITSIINLLAQAKKINIVLPQGAQVIKEKFTYKSPEPLTISAAWKFLISILDMADYIMIQKDTDYQIVKRSPDTSREPMPVMIGTPPEDLPSSDEPIRYVYFLSNIKITTEPDHEINVILKELLSSGAVFRVDVPTNSLLLIDKASKIKDIMSIIARLDQQSFQEKMEFLPLNHSDARIVAELVNEGLLKAVAPNEGNRYHLDARKQNNTQFFSRYTKVIPITHSNSLMIIGRAQTVERLIDFIKQYIDCELASGKSILHVYQLQYLNAASFAPVLQRIVDSSRTGGTGQSKAGEAQVKGTERFFDEVIIKTDTPIEEGEGKYWGGNKLIIACRDEDAKQIEKLIEELDIPQPQVLLEVLVADLSVDDIRSLGAVLRNPAKIPIPNKMAFQSAQFDPAVVLDQATNPTTVASDLLAPVFNSDGQQTDPSAVNLTTASFAPSGATLVAINDNDGKTNILGQVLKTFTSSRILSHPHVIATNNKTALVRGGEERLLRDETSDSSGGAAVVKFKKITAELRIEITPRISANDTVNLQVKVNINDFIEGTDAQTTRSVVTNANVFDGSIFALGGLISIVDDQSANKTPGLGDVPGFGWLFKKRTGIRRKQNLTVFISPTIIQPRLRRGIGNFTQDYIDVAKKYAQEGALFDTLKDPITRIFFEPRSKDLDIEASIDKFEQRDNLKFVENKLEDIDMPPVPTKKNTQTNQTESVKKNATKKANNTTDKEIHKDAVHEEKNSNNMAQLGNHILQDELEKSSARLAQLTEQPIQKTAHNTRPVQPNPYQRKSLKMLLQNEENPFVKKT